jgi:hypothetical protein
MQEKLRCSSPDEVCKGCRHAEPHVRTIDCSRGCHQGIFCISNTVYERKMKLKDLKNKAK